MGGKYEPLTGEMLKDGSNPEGVDPVPPLEWKSREDFKDVVLYGLHGSPVCAKIMAYLVKYNIEYKMVAGMGKPGSDYKKMPVLDVNGRQVNDSYIIIKHLVPALTGQPVNEEWEAICSYQLGPSIEDNLTPADAAVWMGSPYGFGPPNFLLKCCLAKVMLDNMIKPNIQKALTAMPEKYKLQPLSEFAGKFKRELGTKKFHNGSEPGNADISFYGVCLPFYFSGCEGVKGMISESGLQQWWDNMDKEIPMAKIYPV